MKPENKQMVTVNETLSRLGSALGRARVEKGSSIQEIADTLALPPELLASIEAGRQRPKLKTLIRILILLKLPPRQLRAQVAEADPATAQLLENATAVYRLYEASTGQA